MPTPKDLLELFRRCQELKLIIKDRQGAGRYKKHDSARLHFMLTRVEPDIKLGLMPTAFDHRMLFDMPAQDSLGRGDKALVDGWADAIKPDPRSKKSKASNLHDEESQTSILTYAHVESEYMTSARAEYGRRGRPPAFRFGADFSDAKVKNMTVNEAIRNRRAERARD